MSAMALIISADELKKGIPGYNPFKSHLVHRESARLADRQYAELLKTSEFKEVILMSGGGASGKTEFISEYLINKPAIILDGTLPSFTGAKIKIQLAKKYHKKVTIIAIWPQDLKIAFAAFLQRERKYPDEYFYKTHSVSRKTLLEVAQSDLDVEIIIYENSYDDQGLIFYEYIFDSRKHLVDELRDSQYTEEEILNIVTKNHD